MSKILTQQENRKSVKRYHEGEPAVVLYAKTRVAKSTFYTWVKQYGNSLEASGNEISQREIRRLKRLGDITGYHVTQSFSPSSSPHHNAVMESFFSSMEQEEIYYPPCWSVAEFHKRVKDYMQFYDNDCLHSTLRYKTPNAHESMFYGKAEAELR